jgi:methylmalonyl-CoA/ethylmalonyl-CoA epimerase
VKVDHFGIVVPDLDAATAFYRDVLKCEVTDPVIREDQGIKKAFVQFQNMQMELIAPTTAESPIKDVLEDHNVSDYIRRNPGGGLHHVCYTVSDLHAARAMLAAKGYRALGTATSAIGTAGLPILFLDPVGTNGVLIELKQDPAGK